MRYDTLIGFSSFVAAGRVAVEALRDDFWESLRDLTDDAELPFTVPALSEVIGGAASVTSQLH